MLIAQIIHLKLTNLSWRAQCNLEEGKELFVLKLSTFHITRDNESWFFHNLSLDNLAHIPHKNLNIFK